MAERVNRACQLVKRTAQENLSGTGSGILYGTHRASLPGDFPALDTSVLRGSVNTKVSVTPNHVDGFIGTDEKRGRLLELGTRKMLPRPWLRRTLASLRNNVASILRGGV